MRNIFACPCCLAAFVFFSVSANAATWTVTKIADSNDGACDADCSLREAAAASNTDGSPSTILFAPTLNYQTVLVNAGDIPLFGDSLTITGPGAGKLTISGGGANRLFDLATLPILTMTGLKLTGFNGNGFSSSGFGGVFTSFGTSNITLDNIYAVSNGASSQSGIGYFAGGVMNISNSTFSGNSTDNCGTFSFAGGTVTVKNSTFVGNSATSVGGAFCTSSGANVTITNSTITTNTSAQGGGIIALGGSGPLTFGNTVIAANTAGTSPEIHNSSGTVTSAGNNHIGDSAGDSTSTNFPITYIAGDVVNVNPLLGALVNNGGMMPTRLPTAGSLLINTGNNALATAAGLTLDQRGAARIVTTTVDKGATEFGGVAPTAAGVTIGGRVTDLNGLGISKVLVSMTDQQGSTRTAITNPFGYYRFDEVPSGATFVMSLIAKRYTFAPRIITTGDDALDLDFTAQ